MSTVYMSNPPAKKRKASKPSPKQIAQRKKFAAAARARSRAAKSGRALSNPQGATMATKRRKSKKRTASASTSTHRRRSSRRRKSYRRNPPHGARSVGRRSIMGTVTDLAISGVAGLGGMAAGHVALTKLGPMVASATDTPTVAAAKRFGIGGMTALAIAVVAPRVGVRRELANAAALGAIIPALRDVAVALSPEASSVLGASPSFARRFPPRGGSYVPVGVYSNRAPTPLGVYSGPGMDGYTEQTYSRSAFNT